jgi:hypothetical protein
MCVRNHVTECVDKSPRLSACATAACVLTSVHLDNSGSGGAGTAGEKQGDLGVLLSNALVIRSDDPHQTGRGWGKIMKSSAGESVKKLIFFALIGQIPADHLFL